MRNSVLTAAQNAAAEDGRLDHPDAISDSMRSKNLDVLSEVREKLISDEASLAEYDARLQGAAPGDLPYERRQAAALKARAATMRERVNELARMVDRQKAGVATRTARLDRVQTELRAAEARMEAALTRLRDVQSVSGTRSETQNHRSGIVPERPSSPDIVLTVAVACLLAAIFSLLYVTAQFAQRRRALPDLVPAVRTRGHSM